MPFMLPQGSKRTVTAGTCGKVHRGHFGRCRFAKTALKNPSHARRTCPGGGIGRRDRFKICYPLGVPVRVWPGAPKFPLENNSLRAYLAKAPAAPRYAMPQLICSPVANSAVTSMALVSCGIVLQVTICPAPLFFNASYPSPAKTACTPIQTGAAMPAAFK